MQSSGTVDKFPKHVTLILGNETCERFNYYGMKSVLAVYCTTMLAMTEDSATALIHLFGFVNYFTPLLGAWISDKFWGRYKTILWVSLLYCAGSGVLACSGLYPGINYKLFCLYSGLALIALGAGGIKPCVSAFMGDQFKPSQAHWLEKAYNAFYWSINLGSCAAFLVIPFMKDNYGWSWAFGIPGAAMAVATLIFWLGRTHYTILEPEREKNAGGGFAPVLVSAIAGGWAGARQKYSEETVAGVIATLRVLSIFLFIPIFFALFEQSGSTWVFQGKQMAAFSLFGHSVTPEQMQSFNPVFVLTLIPLLTLTVYPLLGKLLTPLRRMGAGMFIAAISYVIVAQIQVSIEAGETPTLAWQILPYLIITIAEILISATGLEFAYTQAPKFMKSTLTSFWLVAIALGQLLIVLITKLLGESGGSGAVTSERFFLYAGMMAVNAVLFTTVAGFYKYADRK